MFQQWMWPLYVGILWLLKNSVFNESQKETRIMVAVSK